ncbi:MAG: 3,4-dihydroxy-2-butanone-4-phosphate synthase [Saprospiraceae bacterium]|jgi:3,4-dihydroxy 2-butanone 4-phosphate synthase/GTP cyclohydrolase II
MSGNEQKEAPQIRLDSIEAALEDIRKGRVIIVVDDEDRENEGDFICAADMITPEIINFMATHGRGLICAPIVEERAEELKLNMMVSENTALHETAFTVSIDLIGKGVTTGISAQDRAKCIKALVDPNAKSTDFARPGHIFPLKAKSGGVLRRTGHTEAAIDLARLAGFSPAGVLVEILNPDGTMARLPELMDIAHEFDLRIVAIKDLVAYRMKHERIVRRELSTKLDTRYGAFEVTAFTQETNGDVHLALKLGDWAEDEPVLVRVHSVTETRDILHTLLDDHAQLITRSMERISREGKGLFVYMRHSEKDNSMLQVLSELKEKSGQELGSVVRSESAEQRDFGVGAQILVAMNVRRIRLMTNHPKRRIGLIGYGLEIVDYESF